MVAVRRFYCVAVPSALLFVTLIFALVSRTDLRPRVYHAFTGATGGLANPPNGNSDVYNWTTHSEFEILGDIDVKQASIDDLCAHFPTHLLNDIQPVLKTGHGVIDTRLAAQLKSVSACFGSNLLIFSDKAEIYQNHTLIDVIAEIPPYLRAQHPEQFLAYEALYDPSIHAPPDGGWKIDKFKFLPEVSAAWRLRPGKRWYVFYEGDTYVFWDNVFRYLEHFDPDKPWYFGSPSPGRDDPRTKKKTWFANGGPGFILSREALRRITRDDWDAQTGEYLGPMLTRKYWDELVRDCCGDSVLGWSLYQEKVIVNGIWPMMNPHSPEGVPLEDRYWCQPMMTMHKPAIEKMEELWRWQFSARKADRPLLYRDLALSYHQIHKLSLKNDWRNDEWGEINLPDDHPGNASPNSCNTACRENDRCFQWTFHHPDKCVLVNNFRFGRVVHAGPDETGQERKFTAGWMSERIEAWANARPCDDVQWVRPSLTRIY